MAKAKKNDIKVSNYIPPQCYGRWSAAQAVAKEIEKQEEVAMVTGEVAAPPGEGDGVKSCDLMQVIEIKAMATH